MIVRDHTNVESDGQLLPLGAIFRFQTPSF
jgi:hypothetical protein